jgi:hypothetical protein
MFLLGLVVVVVVVVVAKAHTELTGPVVFFSMSKNSLDSGANFPRRPEREAIVFTVDYPTPQ